MIVSEAVELIHAINPDKFPSTRQMADTVRQACRNGNIENTRKTLTGRWIIDEDALREWANNPAMHKPGPRKGSK